MDLIPNEIVSQMSRKSAITIEILFGATRCIFMRVAEISTHREILLNQTEINRCMVNTI